MHGTIEEQSLGSFTRRKLRNLSNWSDWQGAEFKQLDSMAKQEMYSNPVHAPKDSIVICQHWNYAIKGDSTQKARNCCDGSPRAVPQLKLANTYSSCIEQPCMRMFFALCVHEGFISLKVDERLREFASAGPTHLRVHRRPIRRSVPSLPRHCCLSRYGASRATRSPRTPRIWRTLGEIRQHRHRPSWFQVHYSRTQFVSWYIQRTSYVHLLPSR
jgi:hypothetical protein